MTGSSFIEEPSVSPQVQALYDEDLADGGYVWNVSRLWAHQPDTMNQLFKLMSAAFAPSGLSFRQRGILVTAAASALGDSYCSMAWGGKLGQASDAALAAGVLNGSDAALTDQEKAMAAWARKVARDPNATTPADIQALRDSGLTDGQVFAITAFVALRLAFSTINDALGAQPDAQLTQSLPREVREAVTYGRPVAQAPAV
ncbi:MAG: carboxymuconolactone decarboxylase family protein [Streptosporangiaceae bacterium]